MTATRERPFRYFRCCVSWPESDLDGLDAMIADAETVTRRTFLRHVDPESRRELERCLGYSRGGLTMASDWHVSYHKSRLHGHPVYFLAHSAIEHVFITDWSREELENA